MKEEELARANGASRELGGIKKRKEMAAAAGAPTKNKSGLVEIKRDYGEERELRTREES